jgi:predicted transcriptional regulator
MFASLPKSGKTTLIFGFLRAVQQGEEFLGVPVEHGIKTLYLTEEDLWTLAEKAFRFQFDAGDVDLVLLSRTRQAGLSWHEIMESAIAYCREHGFGLIVVDTISKWARLEGDRENQSGAVIEAMEPFDELAGSDIAVWILHHLRKGGGKFGEGQRGSGAYMANVDAYFEVRNIGEDVEGPRILVSEGTRLRPPTPIAVTFDYDSAEFEHTTDIEAAKTSKRSKMPEVLEVIKARGVATCDQIVRELNISTNTARKHLTALYEKGILERRGAGVGQNPHTYSLKDEE